MWRLDTSVQNYEWGKEGDDSIVARLKHSEGDGRFQIDRKKTYAELWIGTHPNGPSRLAVTDAKSPRAKGQGPFLIELLEEHPEYLGNDYVSEDGDDVGDIMFLFKVLSIAKALSIQAHPDKITAEKIYAARPDLYKDDNHKPEMAVAITPFEGLCGFRPFEEVVYALHKYPELRGLVNLSAAKKVCDVPKDQEKRKTALRGLFVSYIKAKPTVVRSQIAALVQRLKAELEEYEAKRKEGEEPLDGETANSTSVDSGSSGGGGGGGGGSVESPTTSDSNDGMTDPEAHDLEDDHLAEDIWGAEDPDRLKKLRKLQKEDYYVQKLILQLDEQYPGDIGIMMPLLLNYLRMKQGEAFYMGANEPHAYLSGDLLEVMARSDNVIRVALTPKYRDVPLLCEILTYDMGPPPLITPIQEDQCVLRYTPPIKDFEFIDIQVTRQIGEYVLPPISVSQLMICIDGCGVARADGQKISMRPGVTMFVKSGAIITFEYEDFEEIWHNEKKQKKTNKRNSGHDMMLSSPRAEEVDEDEDERYYREHYNRVFRVASAHSNIHWP